MPMAIYVYNAIVDIMWINKTDVVAFHLIVLMLKDQAPAWHVILVSL